MLAWHVQQRTPSGTTGLRCPRYVKRNLSVSEISGGSAALDTLRALAMLAPVALAPAPSCIFRIAAAAGPSPSCMVASQL